MSEEDEAAEQENGQKAKAKVVRSDYYLDIRRKISLSEDRGDKLICLSFSSQKSKIKLARELSDIVIYCKSVHFNGFEHARDNQAFYEMSSFKESKAFSLADTSGEHHSTKQELDS